MSNLLILYASKGGSTAEVANTIAVILKSQGISVDVQSADTFTGDIHPYDGVILGTPIYKGVWMSSLWRNVRRLESQFADKPVWGFSLCMRVLEPAGRDYAHKNYLPHHVLDKLNLQDYHFFGGRLLDLSIMERYEFHETYDGAQGRKEGDYRDWEAIRTWTLQIAKAVVRDEKTVP